MNESELSILMTVKEAADYLRVSPQTIRRWIDENFLVYIRVGRDYRIIRDSLPKPVETKKNFDKS